MPNINFVPDDYIQSNESRRANLLCGGLLIVVMSALAGSFVTIKIRQKASAAQEALVNVKMTRLQEQINKFEQLQAKRKEMMKTALTTAELIEPVPRSVLLASLTNNLPPGTSLLELNLTQKEGPPKPVDRVATTKYQAAKAKNKGKSAPVEREVETLMDIGGMAPSDLQVAAYIEQLAASPLLDQVALVESKEYKVEGSGLFRQFKLRAVLKMDTHLTAQDVEQIRTKAERSVYNF